MTCHLTVTATITTNCHSPPRNDYRPSRFDNRTHTLKKLDSYATSSLQANLIPPRVNVLVSAPADISPRRSLIPAKWLQTCGLDYHQSTLATSALSRLTRIVQTVRLALATMRTRIISWHMPTTRNHLLAPSRRYAIVTTILTSNKSIDYLPYPNSRRKSSLLSSRNSPVRVI